MAPNRTAVTDQIFFVNAAFFRWWSVGVFSFLDIFRAYQYQISCIFWSPPLVLPWMGAGGNKKVRCEATTATKILGSIKRPTIGQTNVLRSFFLSESLRAKMFSLSWDKFHLQIWNLLKNGQYLDRSSWTDLARSAEKERKPSRIFSWKQKTFSTKQMFWEQIEPVSLRLVRKIRRPGTGQNMDYG